MAPEKTTCEQSCEQKLCKAKGGKKLGRFARKMSKRLSGRNPSSAKKPSKKKPSAAKKPAKKPSSAKKPSAAKKPVKKKTDKSSRI